MTNRVLLKRVAVAVACTALLSALIVLLLTAPGAHSRETEPGERWAHSSNGATQPARNWYIAEGATANGYETWILIDNPGEEAATVELHFHTDGQEVGPVEVAVDPLTRASVNVGDHVSTYNVATMVESDLPVVAARSMYGPDGCWAHSAVGVAETGETWYFPEGAAVGSEYETWILLHNPGRESASVKLSFHTSEGVVGPVELELPGTSRTSVNAGDYVYTFDVSTVVESDRPIVAARTMYGIPDSDPRERVLDVAYQQLGKPYRSGASGPDSFDCSGLTRYCYSVGAGMEIPHSSYAQANCGVRVEKEDLVPGDIVAFHGWGHVGIYVGDGNYIHSPQTGEFVEIEPLASRSDYCGAVRP